MSEDLRYVGPNPELDKPVGSAANVPVSRAVTAYGLSYANKEYLLNYLAGVIAAVDILTNDLEKDLQQYTMHITSGDDTKLIQAQQSEWLPQLGAVKYEVSYDYYKLLGTKTTSGASYIRKKYETASQNITGTNSLELLSLAKTIRDEAQLALQFVNDNVDLLGDSSERRTVELLQDWAEAALNHTNRIRALVESRGAPQQLPQGDIALISPEEASSSQALFKVALNKINVGLNQNIENFKRNYSDYADVFYKNFLSPAINFRLNVTRKIYPIMPGTLGKEVNAATSAIDDHLDQILTDQIRRNQMFDTSMVAIVNQIATRDKYRSYVVQLASKGTSIPSSGSQNLSTKSTLTSTQTQVIQNAVAISKPVTSSTSSTNNFLPDHGRLSNLDDDFAHFQYLLRRGGILTGNVVFENENITIDGMNPHTHAHSGIDGSSQIHGGDIVGGTLSQDSINTVDTPIVPMNLQYVGSSILVSNGVATVSAQISFDGDTNNNYEIQISPFNSQSVPTSGGKSSLQKTYGVDVRLV